MSEPLQQRQADELGRYVNDVLFADFKANRIALEDKWNRNLAAIAGNPDLDPKGTWKKSEKAADWQSDSVLNITRQKCVACEVLMEDAVLKGGRIPFMLTPLDEDGRSELTETGEPDEEQSNEQEDAIHHQFERCSAIREFTKMLRSDVDYGCFWAKRYTHFIIDESYEETHPGLFEEQQFEEAAPGVEHVSNWKMFWDMEERDIRKGRGIIQEEFLSAYDMRRFIGQPHYFEEAIKQAIKAGAADSAPESSDEVLPPELRELSKRKKTITHHEFWGRVPRKVVEAHEAQLLKQGLLEADSMNFDDPDVTDGDEMEIMCCVSNGFVTRYVRTEDARERPFYYKEFEENHERAGGLGMADAVENDQKVLTGAIRAFEDNKKLTSSLILAIKRNLLDDDFTDLNQAVNLIDLDEECDDAGKAIQQLVINDVGDSLLKLIELYLEFADLNSFIPRAQQGQLTMNQETATQFLQRLERSGKYIGAAVRRFDEFIVEVVRDFYRYNMGNPEHAGAKANYKVKALGFTSFENKVIRLQKLMQMLQLLLSDERLGADTKLAWLVEEIAKALDLDPEQILLSDTEKAEKQDQQRQAQESDPAYQGALRKMELELQQQEISNQKTLAETQKLLSAIKKETEELELKRVEVIRAIEEQAA